MADLNLIKDITNAFGPSGFEEDVCKVVKKYSSDFSLENDAMYNVYMKGPKFSGQKPILMLDAHLDECGFMIQSIRENGLLNFIMLGNMHLTSLPAHTVLIRNRAGKLIKGIITSKPVHFLNAKESADCSLDIEQLAIDVGASSREEVLNVYGIHPGDPAVPDVKFEYQEEHGICFGKAFDNRMGCTCIIETMKNLKDDDLAVDVIGAFAAQEEVGMRGAKVTSQVVEPDLAIVFEGSPADDFYYSVGLSQGALHKGVQIRCMDKSYISNTDFIALAHEVGDSLGIPYQDTVRRGGSTDAGMISLTGKAIPVLVLGIPSRYVHSHHNFCAMEDVDATIRMATEVIRALNDETISKIKRMCLF